MVVQGRAKPSLLENYSRERVGAAREIIDEAGKSTRFMTPPTKGFRLLRDAVLSLSLTQEFVRPLFHWRTSRPHAYEHSALNSPCDDNALFAGGLSHGAPPQNIRLGEDQFLLDKLGAAFELLYFTDADALPADIQRVVTDIQATGMPLRVTAIRRSGTASVLGVDQTLLDPAGQVHQRYGVQQAGSAYLLRPDQHVCGRWLQLDAQRLKATLEHIQQC